METFYYGLFVGRGASCFVCGERGSSPRLVPGESWANVSSVSSNLSPALAIKVWEGEFYLLVSVTKSIYFSRFFLFSFSHVRKAALENRAVQGGKRRLWSAGVLRGWCVLIGHQWFYLPQVPSTVQCKADSASSVLFLWKVSWRFGGRQRRLVGIKFVSVKGKLPAGKPSGTSRGEETQSSTSDVGSARTLSRSNGSGVHEARRESGGWRCRW